MSEQNDARKLDVLVIGAGFAGLYETYRLQKAGFEFLTVEAGDDVGGTWYWNRYPGAQCDVVSMEYSFSFDAELQQDWVWSKRYAPQPEILRYAQHVADRFGLRDHIRFNTKIASLDYDEARGRWTARAEDGAVFDAQFVVTAVGCLSTPKPPEIPGIDSFAGEVYYTSLWPKEPVDFAGKRVGVIGTGSSGVQTIPVLAEQAAEVTVFQRTPAFSLPAQNRAMAAEEIAEYKAHYPELREKARNTRTGLIVNRGTKSAREATEQERQDKFDECWGAGLFACMSASFTDITTDEVSNEFVAEYLRGKIKEIVQDPRTAEDLTPRTFPFGAKRVCLDSGYYETFNRENVHLVSLQREPIVEITSRGIRTSQRELEFDVLVFATGFDAVTGPLLRLNIHGKGGIALADEWKEAPKTYMGLQVAGFPNLFTVTGPGSPSILSNVMLSIEQHVEWITDTLVDLRERGVKTIEAERDAQEAWFEENNRLAGETLYVKAKSWFMGANVPGKPVYFLPYIGGFNVYREKCEAVRAEGYAGFMVAA